MLYGLRLYYHWQSAPSVITQVPIMLWICSLYFLLRWAVNIHDNSAEKNVFYTSLWLFILESHTQLQVVGYTVWISYAVWTYKNMLVLATTVLYKEYTVMCVLLKGQFSSIPCVTWHHRSCLSEVAKRGPQRPWHDSSRLVRCSLQH